MKSKKQKMKVFVQLEIQFYWQDYDTNKTIAKNETQIFSYIKQTCRQELCYIGFDDTNGQDSCTQQVKMRFKKTKGK